MTNSSSPLRASAYSIFGIGVDRKHTLKWLFPQEKATLYGFQKVYVHSESALIAPDVETGADRVCPGDAILLSGYIGDHGMTILSQREGLEFEGDLRSDCAALNGLVDFMFEGACELGSASFIRMLRDPTRCGVASTLNEIAGKSGVAMLLEENQIPVHDSVCGACELLGLDPLYVANEGKLLAVVSSEVAGEILFSMRNHPLGRDDRIVGRVLDSPAGMVLLKTAVGGTRVVDTLFGEQLPRIC